MTSQIQYNLNLIPNREPLPDQKLVFNSTGKLNTVPSTRRSGKTTGIKYYSVLYAASGKQIAVVYPTYDECKEIFLSIQLALPDLLMANGVDKGALIMRLRTGGTIRFFSYEAFSRIRGKKVHYVFCDEFQECRLDESQFFAALLPTLADFRGQAFFFGTPKKSTLIHSFSLKTEPEWKHFKMQAVNNPFISPEEIALQKKILPPLVFQQEWLAEFVDFSGQLWMYCFDPKVHLEEGIKLDPDTRILLGFDFNVDPCTCIVSQKVDDICTNGGGLNILKEITNNQGTRMLAKDVRRWLDMQNHNGNIHITGDVSGSKMDSRANISDYQILREELQIPLTMFIDTTRTNPNLAYSRDLCNTLFYNQCVFVDKDECPILVKELGSSKPMEGTDKLIKDRTANKNDSMDAFRYIVNALFKSIDDITRFSRVVNGLN